jgi:hypothetical protein
MKRFTKILALAVLTLSLSSCLKDKGYENDKYGINIEEAEQYKVINMPVTGTTFTIAKTVSLATAGGTAVTNTLPIHLSAKDVASEDIAVTVAPDAAVLATYNATLTAANQYVQAPAANYTIANGGITTIPSGSRDAAGVAITYTPNTLGVGRWAIPVKITSVNKAGYTISGNQYYRILTIIVNP